MNKILRNVAYVALLLSMGLQLTSCSKKDDEDDKGPKDSNAPYVGFEQYPTSVKAGLDYKFELTLKDDINLGEAKVEFHNAFDQHTHEGGRLAAPFSYSKTYALSGDSFNEFESISVASDASSGPYHLVITYKDAKGNAGAEIAKDVWVIHGSAPQVSLPDFGNGTKTAIRKGEDVRFAGFISDQDGLSEIRVNVYKDGDPTKVAFEYTHDNEGRDAWNFSEINPLNIPTSFESGVTTLLKMDVWAVDVNQNHTLYSFYLEASN